MCFKHFADGDENQYHCRRLEVELVHPRHGRFRAAVHLRIGHHEKRINAPQKRSRSTQRNERIHIGRTMHNALKAGDEELFVDDHDDDRQQKLDKPHSDMVPLQPSRYRPAPHMRAHGKIHEHEKKAEAYKQPAL